MLMVFVAWFADVITIYEPVAISFANMLVSPDADFSLERISAAAIYSLELSIVSEPHPWLVYAPLLSDRRLDWCLVSPQLISAAHSTSYSSA